ncbi:MAG: DUF3824 domain-containing protein [Thermoplasmata archaeon]
MECKTASGYSWMRNSLIGMAIVLVGAVILAFVLLIVMASTAAAGDFTALMSAGIAVLALGCLLILASIALLIVWIIGLVKVNSGAPEFGPEHTASVKKGTYLLVGAIIGMIVLSFILSMLSATFVNNLRMALTFQIINIGVSAIGGGMWVYGHFQISKTHLNDTLKKIMLGLVLIAGMAPLLSILSIVGLGNIASLLQLILYLITFIGLVVGLSNAATNAKARFAASAASPAMPFPIGMPGAYPGMTPQMMAGQQPMAGYGAGYPAQYVPPQPPQYGGYPLQQSPQQYPPQQQPPYPPQP